MGGQCEKCKRKERERGCMVEVVVDGAGMGKKRVV